MGWERLTEWCSLLSASVSPLSERGSCLPSRFMESFCPHAQRSALIVLLSGAHGSALIVCVYGDEKLETNHFETPFSQP